MAEKKTEPEIMADDAQVYTCFGEDHTLNDIARWIMENRSNAEEMVRILQGMLADD